MNNYNSLEEKIEYICQHEYEYFLNKSNVIGVALGYKIIKDFYTCQKCITVFVTKKLSCDRLSTTEMIPNLYKGCPTDVKESEIPVCDALKTRIRPVINGYSIGNILENNFGTAGCLVADKYLYILSNNHVLALNNRAPIESVILQPGVADGGKIAKDVIGHLNKFIPIKFIEGGTKPENIVDCALCKVINRSFVSSQIAFSGIPKGIAKAKLGDKVKKTGRTTELTTGKIVNTSGTFIVNCARISKQALFTHQTVTTKIGTSGDSGSLVLNEDNYALGLYMGSINDKGLFNPIQQVLDSLKVKLVTT